MRTTPVRQPPLPPQSTRRQASACGPARKAALRERRSPPAELSQ